MVTETSDITVETEITDVVIVIVDVTVVDISLSTPIKKVIQGFHHQKSYHKNGLSLIL